MNSSTVCIHSCRLHVVLMEPASQPDSQAEGAREREERILDRRKRVEAKLEARRKTETGEEPQEVHGSEFFFIF